MKPVREHGIHVVAVLLETSGQVVAELRNETGHEDCRVVSHQVIIFVHFVDRMVTITFRDTLSGHICLKILDSLEAKHLRISTLNGERLQISYLRIAFFRCDVGQVSN